MVVGIDFEVVEFEVVDLFGEGIVVVDEYCVFGVG